MSLPISFGHGMELHNVVSFFCVYIYIAAPDDEIHFGA
jgi:hypothetical protein